MKTINLNNQVENQPAESDYNVEFQLRQEKKGKTVQTKDKLVSHLMFILEGEINISYHEFKNHLCKAGEMVFIPQNAVASLEAFSETKCLLMSFNNHISLHSIMEWNELREYTNERSVFHKLDIRSPLNEVIDSIIYYLNNNVAGSGLSEVKQKEIFLILKVFYTKQELARFLKPLLKQDSDFKAQVISNYREARNIEDLAEKCNLSVRVFTRRFKSQFNDSPYRWMLRQRAKQIKVLLADKRIPMHSIVKDFGFSSPAHFTTYCKKQFGCTPSNFRNTLTGKTAESTANKTKAATNRRHKNSAEA
jgi:AraC-like DNA-binding protein/mannose-6-phosphate isomerase-like protein (cupin superfamily)